MIHFPHIEITENVTQHTVEKTTYEVNGKVFDSRLEAEAEAHVESVAAVLDLYSAFLSRRALDANKEGNVGVAKLLCLCHARAQEILADEVGLATLAGLSDFLQKISKAQSANFYSFKQMQDMLVRVLAFDDRTPGVVRDQLAKFGVSKLSELQSDSYYAFAADLQDALVEVGIYMTILAGLKGDE